MRLNYIEIIIFLLAIILLIYIIKLSVRQQRELKKMMGDEE